MIDGEGVRVSIAGLAGLTAVAAGFGGLTMAVFRAGRRDASLVTKDDCDKQRAACTVKLEDLDRRFVSRSEFTAAMDGRNERHEQIATHVQTLSNRVGLLQRKMDRHLTYLATVLHMALSKQGVDVPPFPRDDDGPGG